MMKRLFFALWPDNEVRNALVENTHAIVAASNGRPVIPANLHLTLAFLHSVEADLLPCICDAAERARTNSFSLSFDQTGYWSRSKILWLGLSKTPDVLIELVDNLWGQLADCGFTPEKRHFKPHITLARKVRNPHLPTDQPPVVWPVTSFSLIESITGQRQATYSVLANWTLA